MHFLIIFCVMLLPASALAQTQVPEAASTAAQFPGEITTPADKLVTHSTSGDLYH
jgi:hypothetical protein